MVHVYHVGFWTINKKMFNPMAQNPIKYSWLTTTIAPEEVFELCVCVCV